MNIIRNALAALALALAGVMAAGLPAMAEGQTHHIAIHVSQSDPGVLNMALNNVRNIRKYYQSVGDDVVIEVVAYGPGLTMLIPGKSPVEDRIKTLSLEIDNLTFSACANTRRKMSRKLGQEVAIMEEARMVPSGVVRLVELQEQGYAYVRP